MQYYHNSNLSINFTGLLGTCNARQQLGLEIPCNNYFAFLEQQRSVSANLASFLCCLGYLLTLYCKTASFVISTPSLETDELLKVPGNTEDYILSFPNLKGLFFFLCLHHWKGQSLFLHIKTKRHHKQSRPQQLISTFVQHQVSGNLKNILWTSGHSGEAPKPFANLDWATGILRKTKLSYTQNTKHKNSTTHML